MDEEEDIFEDIDTDYPIEEEVSSEPIKNKQPRNNTIYNSVNSLRKTKNNEQTANKLNDIRNKKQSIPNSGNIGSNVGKEIGNKLAGRSEEEKGSAEKVVDEVAGKAASTAITAATGLSGPAADAAGQILTQLAKKAIAQKIKRIKIACAIGATIIVLLISFLFFFKDDQSDTSVITNRYVTGNMDIFELLEYLAYIDVCPSLESLKENVGEADNFIDLIISNVEIVRSCVNSLKYYKSLKTEYDDNKESCKEGLKEMPNFWNTTSLFNGEDKFLYNPKAINYFILNKDKADCQVTLPTQLIMETMSYGLDDQELFNKSYTDRYVDYGTDVRNLSNALTEFVHESCWMWEWWNPQTRTYQSTSCTGCTKEKRNKDGYYFQVSFNKYVSYLKFGDTSTHPNYQNKPYEKGKDYDHECVGPENDVLEKGYDSSANNYEATEGQILGTGSGTDIANYALQFVGNPYVYGGTDLYNGIDCSGFTMKIYEHFGISLPRTSTSQAKVGKSIGNNLADAKPGDLICYSGHVGIYIGNNQIVNASNSAPYPKGGIKTSNANYKPILTIRRIVE